MYTITFADRRPLWSRKMGGGGRQKMEFSSIALTLFENFVSVKRAYIYPVKSIHPYSFDDTTRANRVFILLTVTMRKLRDAFTLIANWWSNKLLFCIAKYCYCSRSGVFVRDLREVGTLYYGKPLNWKSYH